MAVYGGGGSNPFHTLLVSKGKKAFSTVFSHLMGALNLFPHLVYNFN